jgi:predicted transcriptional regulator
MKTSVSQSSIDAFYGVVQTKKERQYEKILAAMQGRDLSFSEIFELTGILPSTASARINELRDKLHLVERAPRRECSKTGMLVVPHRIKAKQLELV